MIYRQQYSMNNGKTWETVGCGYWSENLDRAMDHSRHLRATTDHRVKVRLISVEEIINVVETLEK